MRLKSMIAMAVALAAGCSGEPTSPGGDADGGLPPGVEALQVRNVKAPAPDLLTGGQLTPEQMRALRDLGYRTFVNLRVADEDGTGWEEQFAAAEGIDFVRIPVAGAAGATRENAQLLADAMAEGGPAVVYCASGNRVGALFALKAHYIDGRSVEEALQFGSQAGLTRLEPRIRELLEQTSD